MTRILMLLTIGACTSFAQTPVDPPKGTPDPKEAITWYDGWAFAIEGRGWTDTKDTYDRFPAKAEGKVPASVWGLSRHSAGIAVRFVTTAPSIHLKWSVTSDRLAMPHMAATGVSGVDLYVRDAKEGKWIWAGVGQPKQKVDNRATITVPKGSKECLLYLPLYNGTSAISIGTAAGETVARPPLRSPDRRQPIVFYGTSITQGGCASRPGMVHTAILGRRFDRPVINLGFSGSGKMDASVVDLLAELDPAVYVIDCLPNMTAKEIAERTGPLVATLRKARPKTPILLVEDRTYTNARVNDGLRIRNTESRAAFKKEFDKLIVDKVPAVTYLQGDQLMGDDGEATVDGSHPTDLGFLRQADVMADAIAPLLPQPSEPRSRIDAYPKRLSYQPGDVVSFQVSTPSPTFDVWIERAGARPQEVWSKKGVTGTEHPIPTDASANGCEWPETFRLTIPEDWKSGYYQVRFQASDRPAVKGEAFFIVRPARPGSTSKVLLQMSTNTYNAYTNWGGYSLYAYNGRHKVQGRRVSFERPISSQFSRWEQQFIEWAEGAGYVLEYAANNDLEERPDLLKAYRLVLSVGHDEYWSAGMRDRLESFIKDGGNVAFFSGNTCCWQVRNEGGGRAMVCFKQAFVRDPIYTGKPDRLLSTLWSHHLVDRPENRLTGVGFLWGGYHRSHGQFMDGKAEFTVHRPDHPFLAGTGLKRGDAFGSSNKIVGYECDGCELNWIDGVPVPTGRDGTPKNFTVLATCPARWHPDDCEWYERWSKGRTGQAVMGTYSAGGTVFTVGTTDWSHGLRGNDPAVVRITKNILDQLGK